MESMVHVKTVTDTPNRSVKVYLDTFGKVHITVLTPGFGLWKTDAIVLNGMSEIKRLVERLQETWPTLPKGDD